MAKLYTLGQYGAVYTAGDKNETWLSSSRCGNTVFCPEIKKVTVLAK